MSFAEKNRNTNTNICPKKSPLATVLLGFIVVYTRVWSDLWPPSSRLLARDIPDPPSRASVRRLSVRQQADSMAAVCSWRKDATVARHVSIAGRT